MPLTPLYRHSRYLLALGSGSDQVFLHLRAPAPSAAPGGKRHWHVCWMSVSCTPIPPAHKHAPASECLDASLNPHHHHHQSHLWARWKEQGFYFIFIYLFIEDSSLEAAVLEQDGEAKPLM